MSARNVRRYVDALLHGRRPKDFRPDAVEAAQVRTAIELVAVREDAGPSAEFVAALERRLASELGSPVAGFDGEVVRDIREQPGRAGDTRRQVIAGTSIAAAAAAAAVVADHLITRNPQSTEEPSAATTLDPTHGTWHAVAASVDIADGMTHPFDVGTITGFVRRVEGAIVAVSGVCTHQGCRLWFDNADDRLRCPCHSTSFAVTGQVLTHQLPIAPAPLPHIQVRETAGVIEVFAPAKPA